MKGVHIWHNFYPVGDIVEYIPGMLYGVMEYPIGVKNGDTENGKWLATQMSPKDVDDYLEWCFSECDRLIYNVLIKKPEDKEWLLGDENENDDEY